ncbi:hypothetical protein KC717_06885 [Candidatus Dojkabacteria bacterium]|uniref:Uncharacterized protein n=1 Tax=Candidatus Dojkabacteria bacterium TaxID=2099670 RepID=A0A955L9K1_9BACT|nr:hypothetical protein [Candidatus Dojkabacteria bacterium]
MSEYDRIKSHFIVEDTNAGKLDYVFLPGARELFLDDVSTGINAGKIAFGEVFFEFGAGYAPFSFEIASLMPSRSFIHYVSDPRYSQNLLNADENIVKILTQGIPEDLHQLDLIQKKMTLIFMNVLNYIAVEDFLNACTNESSQTVIILNSNSTSGDSHPRRILNADIEKTLSQIGYSAVLASYDSDIFYGIFQR